MGTSSNSHNNAIDIEHYEHIHTIHKALDEYAKEALKELDDEQTTIARKLFQSLTTVDAGNRRIRRPAHLNEVCAISNATPQQVLDVINRFREQNRSFLVLSSENADDNPLIDISHESLIRQWQQLADWVDEEANSAKTFQRLAESAQLHKQNQSNFYREIDLEQAQEWQQKQQPSEVWAQRYNPDFNLAIQFLEDSQQEYQQQQAREKAEQEKLQKLLKDKAELEEHKRRQAEQQAEQQGKALKKSRWLSSFMAMFAMLMIVAAFFAWDASQESIAAKEEAETAKNKAVAASEKTEQQVLEANYYLAKAYEQKIKIAIDDADKTKSLTQYRKAWLYALEAEGMQIPQGKQALKQVSLNKVTNFSINGLNPDKKAPLAPLNIGTVSNAVAYSPDGSVIVSGSDDKALKLWDAKTGALKQTLKGHEGTIWAVSYSLDGSVIASGSSDKTLKLWDKYALMTQDLFYKYEPVQVSLALQFLWQMGLDKDDLRFVHQVRTPALYPNKDGYYYSDSPLLPLLDMSKQGEVKADQLIRWLQEHCAYKTIEDKQTCEANKTQ